MLDKLKLAWETFHSRSFTVSLRKQYPDVYKWVLDQPDIIPTKSFTDKVYTLLNPNQPICENTHCGNLVNTVNRLGWAKYCSSKCKGQQNSLNSRSKARITSRKNWGVDNPVQHQDIREKMKKTMMNNIGVEFALQSDTCQAKKSQAIFDLYGVYHAAQSPVIQHKMIDTYLNNFGYTNPSKRHIPQDVVEKLNSENWLREENSKLPMIKIANNLGISTFTLSKAFRAFGIMPIRHNTFVSISEQEIVNFIKKIRSDIEIITSDRTILSPYELDIYLPELKLAFEYNGLYYHHEDMGKDQHYHLYKTNTCKEKGIKLIHIWENDYLNNKEIILSKISHLLGESISIYARKCAIQEISLECSSEFLNKTHIQGTCSSTIKLGLFYNTELIAVMTFGISRFNNIAEWELLRYSSKLYHNIIGGFSKLLTYFIRTEQPKSIISYSDKCWSTGDVYQKNGFTFIGSSKPSYFYTKNFIDIEHRMSYQKKKLKYKLDIFDDSLSESENMKNNGFYKIWNCGNDSWIWK